jgi:hypothetical protein
MELFLQIVVIALLVASAWFSYQGYDYSMEVYNAMAAAGKAAATTTAS